MATTSLKYVQNDTAPGITFNITRNGAAVDLTGATVYFRIQDPTTGSETNSAHNTCTISSPSTAGICTYAFQSGDISKAVAYQCDISIVWPNSTEETAYNQVILNVRAEA